jgi:tetratricopeptide (TPR) repeat protein
MPTPPKGPTADLLEPTGPYGHKEKEGARLGDRESNQKEANTTIEDRAPDAETLPAQPRSSILDSRSSPFFRTVANLGIQAADALEHAHHLGVIHRDIKPANLMVEARGNLWITDFGLAHCQGAVELTMSGDLLGTLRYMSPEQALAQRVLVDQRTDIYSLGVTLYELLTLEPAFPGTDRRELLRQIAFDEPRPPRRLNKAIPIELETILLKAIEKNPTDRYATAQELADDLERYLKHEPIRARRPTIRQRAAKWIRRHPGVTITSAASALLVLALVASGLAVNNYLILQQQKRTQRNLSLALEALDEIYLQVAEQRLPRDPQRQQEDQELLRKAVAFYERFAEENRTDPAVRHEVGGAYRRVGGIWQLLGQYDKAKAAWTRWGEAVEQLAHEFPREPIYRAELGGSYYNVGTLLAAEGDRTAAAQHYQSASNIWEKLTKDFPEDPMYRRCVACAHNALGGLLGKGGEWRAAAEHHRQAVDLMRQIVEERPKALKYCWELAKDQNVLATALKEQGEWVAAKRNHEEAITILTNLVAECPDGYRNPDELKYNKAPARHEMQSDLASCHFNLAELLMEDGDWKLAEEHYAQALGRRRQLVKDCPAIPEYSQGLAVSLINLGSRLHEDGEWSAAEKHYRQAIDLLRKLVEDYPHLPEYQLDLASGHRNQAAVLVDLDRPEGAEKALDQALALCQKLTTRWPDVPTYSEELATG